MAERVGRVLGGRYRLMAPIGAGASAQVYLADDVTLSRRVAIKALHPALADDESFLRRFRAEARTVAALRHPHIVAVHDWGEDEDGPYLVLEHLAGGSLRSLLDAGGRLTPSQAVRVGLEAARALEHAHRRGLVHRDVKPANLLFDEDGRVAIADFGLARALAEAAWTEPMGAVLGTARYASPEQATGGSVDGRADVYSLALTLVEAVTGRVPFAADTTIATLMARVDRRLDAPPELGPLGPVLERAAHPDVESRLDAVGLVHALEELASSVERPAPLPLAGGAVVDLDADQDATQLPRGDRQRALDLYDHEADDDSSQWAPVERDDGRRRRRWPRVLVALILAIGLAAGGAYAFVEARKPTHPVPRLRGMTLAEARARLAPLDLELRQGASVFDEDVERGRIVEQDPSLGRLKEGETVTVVVSKGAEPRAVPSLEGLDEAAAVEAVEQAGFVPEVERRHHEEAEKGTVLEWSPRDGRHEKGSTVTIVVSDGKAPRTIPGILGELYDKAKDALARLGFGVQREEAFSDKVAAGHVVSTRPAPGQRHPFGAEVVVVVSKGPEKVAVPNVVGKSVDDAVRMIEAAGLRVGGPYGPPNSRRAYSTSPEAGTKVSRGSVVDLYIGR